MRPMIIATSNKGIFRLVDLDTLTARTSKAKLLDVPLKSMILAMSKGMQISNAVLRNGMIIGTQGDLSRYPTIENGGACVILSSIDRHTGYQLINKDGAIVKASRDQVVAFVKQYGAANGKIAMTNGQEYIQAFNGDFNELHLTASKVGNDKGVNVSIKIQGHRDTLNKNANADVTVEIRDADVFRCMTPTQREVLKQYYVWYTTRLYRQMAKTRRLNASPTKLQRLGYMRGENTWEFNGITDTYLEGRYSAKCSLGHNLRYEYHAKCEETGDEIIFGETCASDFFSIDKEDMKKLVKARKIMSDELTLISDAITNNKQKELMGNVSLFYGILRKLKAPSKIIEVFGENVGTNIINFVSNNIPIVESLVILANEEVQRMGVGAFIKHLYGQDYTEILNKPHMPRGNVNVFNKYLEFMFTNRIEGYYSYDPFNEGHKRRDIGGYNKDTRESRKSIIRQFRSYFKLEEFKFRYSVPDELREFYPNGMITYDDNFDHIKEVIDLVNYRAEIIEMLYKEIADGKERYYNEVNEDPSYEFRDAESFITRKLRYVLEPDILGVIYKNARVYYGSVSSRDLTREGEKELIKNEYENVRNKIRDLYNNEIKEALEYKRKREEEIERKEQERKRKEQEELEKARVGVSTEQSNEKTDRVYETYNYIKNLSGNKSFLDDFDIKVVMDLGKRNVKWEDCSDKQKHIVDKVRGKVLGEHKTSAIDFFKENIRDIRVTLGEEDIGYKISNDIVEKYNYEDELSNRQLWRLNDTISRYKKAKNE